MITCSNAQTNMSRKPFAARVRWAAWGLLLLAAAVFGTVAPPTLSAPPYVDVNAGTTTLLSGEGGVRLRGCAVGLSGERESDAHGALFGRRRARV